VTCPRQVTESLSNIVDSPSVGYIYGIPSPWRCEAIESAIYGPWLHHPGHALLAVEKG
jgi:hypothetical protein